MDLIPKKIIPPAEGWGEHTLYLVEVAFDANNPVHYSYLEIGFLNGPDDGPGGYCELWCNNYDEGYKLSDAHYLRAVKKLHTRDSSWVTLEPSLEPVAATVTEPKFRYHMIPCRRGNGWSAGHMVRVLNAQAQQGWEYVGTEFDHFVFRRPKG